MQHAHTQMRTRRKAEGLSYRSSDGVETEQQSWPAISSLNCGYLRSKGTCSPGFEACSAASTTDFITPQFDRKSTTGSVKVPCQASPLAGWLGAGKALGRCTEADWSGPLPCEPRIRAASLRASGRSKLSETNTSFPRRVITKGPSSLLNTCSTLPSSSPVAPGSAFSGLSPEYLRPSSSA